MDEKWTPRRTGELAEVSSGERVVVLDLSRPDIPPTIFVGSARDIWDLIDGKNDVGAIVEGLAPNAVRDDVVGFVLSLVAAGLVADPSPEGSSSA